MSAFEDVLAALGVTAANLLTTIDPTATPTNVAATDATAAGTAILAKLAGGYTLQVFTASDPTWAVPPSLAASTDAVAGAMGGGGKGGNGTGTNGTPSTASGGLGGRSGGMLARKFDPSTLGATVAVVVGAAASTAGADGGTSSFGSIQTSAPNGNGYANGPIWEFTTSAPGAGGNGGSVVSGTQTSGTAGGDTAVATGGAGGAASTGSGAGVGGAGSAGGTGTTGTTPICGGGGGGGGGARQSTASFAAATGGAGGNGGYPGGGSGGGGGAIAVTVSGTGGASGTPANGLVFVLWKA